MIELHTCYSRLEQGLLFFLLLPVLFVRGFFAYLRLMFYRVNGFSAFPGWNLCRVECLDK